MINAVENPAELEFDAVICGGGLAGLTLARQLRRELPDASVAVVERIARPLPEACHKVGESSVELGSHYFDQILGLHDYLKANHIEKNGLRFFCGDGRDPLHQRPEIGPAEFPVLPSYQLDRGTFESDLREMNAQAGVTMLEGSVVRRVTFGDPHHEVVLGDGRTLRGRWLFDASGRARLLSKKLDLKTSGPNQASAAWFRVASRVRCGDLVSQEQTAWHARDVDGNRWQSTIHLMGPGYWVWIIPLSTGFTSIGVVADSDHHDLADFGRRESMTRWLRENEPILADAIADMPFEDFRMMKDYSYLAKQTFDAKARWACVGEAGLFVDPLYSLGSDFVAMSACYATRLMQDERAGMPEDERLAIASELQATFLRLAEDATRTLSGNGDIFPHEDIFGAKLWWDFYNYWSHMCGHFFQEIWRLDLDELTRFRALGERYYALNSVAQRVLEAWADLKVEHKRKTKAFVPLPMFPSVLARQHVALGERLDADATYTKMERDLEGGVALVAEIVAHALRDLGQDNAAEFGERAQLSPEVAAQVRARTQNDGLRRRERLAALPDIGRDMERALGRQEGDASLDELFRRMIPAEPLRNSAAAGKAPAAS